MASDIYHVNTMGCVLQANELIRSQKLLFKLVIMKLTYLLLSVILISCTPEPRVTIFMEKMSIGDMATIVGIQTGKSFVYEATTLWNSDSLNVNVVNKKLEDFMDECCKKWSIKWKYTKSRKTIMIIKER